MSNFQRVSKSQAGVAVRLEMVKPFEPSSAFFVQIPRARGKTPKKKVATMCGQWDIQWIGLRENLQETIDFPIKYGAFLQIFP